MNALNLKYKIIYDVICANDKDRQTIILSNSKRFYEIIAIPIKLINFTNSGVTIVVIGIVNNSLFTYIVHT